MGVARGWGGGATAEDPTEITLVNTFGEKPNGGASFSVRSEYREATKGRLTYSETISTKVCEINQPVRKDVLAVAGVVLPAAKMAFEILPGKPFERTGRQIDPYDLRNRD